MTQPPSEEKAWWCERMESLDGLDIHSPHAWKLVGNLVAEATRRGRLEAIGVMEKMVEEEKTLGKQTYQDRVVACRKRGDDELFINELRIEADGVYSAHNSMLFHLAAYKKSVE